MSKSSRVAALRRQLNTIADELARLESRPSEPDEGTVIQFEMKFGARDYSYAAIRVAGMWYTTGPRSPKAYSWDELLDWMDGNTFGFHVLQRYRSVDLP